MRRGFAALLPPLCVLCALVSCSLDRYGLDELFGRPAPVDERVADRSVPAPSAPAVADAEAYTFIVVADTHFGSAAATLAPGALKALIAARGAELVFVVGDLVDTGLPDQYSAYAAWAAELGVPVYAAIGNHDLYNSGWSSYLAVVGRSYYSFTVGNRSFYILDSGNGTLGRVQLDLLRADFADDPNPKVVICHYPLYNGDDTSYYELTNAAERAALIDLYARSRVELILEGHTHDLRHTRVGAFDEWVCPSLLGASGEVRSLTVTVRAGRIASVAAESSISPALP